MSRWSRVVGSGRVDGSLDRHVSIAPSRCGGTPVRSGAPLRTLFTTAASVSPAKGVRPVAANTIVPAQLNTSDADPTRSPRNCSGDMYAGVPTGTDVRVVASRALAIPKSMTIGPSGPISTLPGLKSRCTIPAWWMAASAVSVEMASRSSAPPDRGPDVRTSSWSVSPATYSLTMYGRSSAIPASSTAAVQKAATRRAASTSRRKLLVTSSSWARCSTLTATSRPSSPTPR